MVYLSDEELSGLKNYKYNVVEDSIAEKLMNPFWNWAVRLLPMWMAPNLVTLIGLLIVVGSSMLFLPFDLEMKDAFPTWTYFVSAAAVFTYMTMDVLDGKQARRTGSSSPLGQMFDHGCDAFSIGFFTITFMKLMQTGDTNVALFIVFLSGFVFHF